MMGKDVLTVGAGVLTGMITGTDLTTTTMTEVEVAIGTAIGPDLPTTAVKTRAGIRIGTIISPGITATATNNRLLIRMTATIKIYHLPTTLPPVPPEHQRHSAELNTAQDADDAEIQRFFGDTAEHQRVIIWERS